MSTDIELSIDFKKQEIYEIWAKLRNRGSGGKTLVGRIERMDPDADNIRGHESWVIDPWRPSYKEQTRGMRFKTKEDAAMHLVKLMEEELPYNQDRADEESMQMELDEIEAREEAVRAIAPELETALTTAFRMLVDASSTHNFPEDQWKLVEDTVNKLEQVRGF